MRITIMAPYLDEYEYDRYLLRLGGCSVSWNNAADAALVLRDRRSDWTPPADFGSPVLDVTAPIGWERLRESLRAAGLQVKEELYPTPAFGQARPGTLAELNDELLVAEGWLAELERHMSNASSDAREALAEVVRATNIALARMTELRKQEP